MPQGEGGMMERMRVFKMREVSAGLVADLGEARAMEVFPLPPERWFERGPRGGLYMATGEREREMGQSGDAFMRDVFVLIDRSASSRYIRPGTRLHAGPRPQST